MGISRIMLFPQIFKMIDLAQWRVNIGMWCCHVRPFKRKGGCYNQQIRPLRTKDCFCESKAFQLCMYLLRASLSHTSVLTYTITAHIFLQLLLSGDVEQNPGPVG